MAVKFVSCTNIEQADEMYWAGLLYFSTTCRWHPYDFDSPLVQDRCKPSRILGDVDLKDRGCGYLVED